MKPKLDRFAVVTATISPERSRPFMHSWRKTAAYHWPLYVVWNGCRDGGIDSMLDATLITRPEIMGVVPSFALGVEQAIGAGAEVIACLHDDLEISEPGWDQRVVQFFESHERCGLAGFGGGRGLGAEGLYDRPYDPMSLARVDFISNMKDAEAHGRRVTEPTRVAALDGFSQVGRDDFFGWAWSYLEAMGVVHHGYDSHLGVLAARQHRDAWMIPVACHHAGGQTAVADGRYAGWAKTQRPDGDADFWRESHRILWEDGRDVLPVRV